MGLGVLEGVFLRSTVATELTRVFVDTSDLQHVPGTVLLNDGAGEDDLNAHGLKHGTGRNAHIILNPQPSEDPNVRPFDVGVPRD